jgi:6-phosphogluconolactonase
MIASHTTKPDIDALAKAVADRIVADAAAAIEARGTASLILSGGSTPEPVYDLLADAELDWGRITVTLADERWVPGDDERSNARLLAQTLFAGPARAARFIPLYRGASPDEDAAAASSALAELARPFDVLLLGMGNDGHTASLFPGGDRLDQALAPDCPDMVLPLRAEGAGVARLTLTLPALVDARNILLMFAGAEKAAVFATASQDGPVADMPIRSVLRHAEAAVDVFSA